MYNPTNKAIGIVQKMVNVPQELPRINSNDFAGTSNEPSFIWAYAGSERFCLKLIMRKPEVFDLFSGECCFRLNNGVFRSLIPVAQIMGAIARPADQEAAFLPALTQRTRSVRPHTRVINLHVFS